MSTRSTSSSSFPMLLDANSLVALTLVLVDEMTLKL